MFSFCNAYRARRQEKKQQRVQQERERLLGEVHSRHAAERCSSEYNERRRRQARQEEYLECQSRAQHRREPPRPSTAPSRTRTGPLHPTQWDLYDSSNSDDGCRPNWVARPPRSKPVPQRPAYHNPFDTDSSDDEDHPSRVMSPENDYPKRLRNVQRYATPQRAATLRPKASERAMPDIAVPWPRRVDSLPRRREPANYHPNHGHRYLREDERSGVEAYPEYFHPLSYGRREAGETNGYRGRRFGQGGAPRPPPKRDVTPQWVGPCPPGWF